MASLSELVTNPVPGVTANVSTSVPWPTWRTASSSTARALPRRTAVAEVVLTHPEAVAFGTVAGSPSWPTPGATVVRLATRLGFPGSPASRRPSRPGSGSACARGRAHPGRARRRRRVAHAAGRARQRAAHAAGGGRRRLRPGGGAAGRPPPASSWSPAITSSGIGAMLAAGLALVRDDVQQVAGPTWPSPANGRLRARRVVVAVDLRRYERWVVEHVPGRRRGPSPWRSPTARCRRSPRPRRRSRCPAEGAGVFDSHVGTLALVNALVTGPRARLAAAPPTARPVESAWRGGGRRSSIADQRDRGHPPARSRRCPSRDDRAGSGGDGARRGLVATADHLASSAGVAILGRQAAARPTRPWPPARSWP